MRKRDTRQFFGLLKNINKQGACLEKEDVCYEFSGGRTQFITELTDEEYNAAISGMIRLSFSKVQWIVPKDKADGMRKVIIGIFWKIGKTTEDAKIWAEKMGVNGEKKQFNDYNEQELYMLIRNAERMQRDHLQGLRNKLANG